MPRACAAGRGYTLPPEKDVGWYTGSSRSLEEASEEQGQEQEQEQEEQAQQEQEM